MESILVNNLLSGNDALLRITKDDVETVNNLIEEFVNNAILIRVFSFYQPYSEGFIENIKTIIKGGDKYMIMEFNMFLNKSNIEDIMKTISVAKESGLKILVVLKIRKNKRKVLNSEINYYSSREDLFLELKSGL